MRPEDEKLIVFEAEKSKLLDHEYDGIKELNHPLPSWWMATFILTIIFSAGYYVYYTFMDGPDLVTLYRQQTETTKPPAQEAGQAGGDDQFNEEKLAALVAAGGVDKGKVTFTTYCVACNAEGAKGNIGPNLTDNFWINGKGSAGDIYKSVALGVTSKGMPAWEGVIGAEAVGQVVAYVASLKGSNPAGAKAAEGTEIK